MSFTGTQEKCKACDKTVYVMDESSADGVSFHKSCFKCSHCKGTLKNLSSFFFLCKPENLSPYAISQEEDQVLQAQQIPKTQQDHCY
ncbi:LIM domain-containing protein WLIM2b [Ranunculus cassubicifolius]